MEIKKLLKSKIEDVEDIKFNTEQFYSFDVNEANIKAIRDRLVLNALILLEDLETNTFVVELNIGKFSKAYVALLLQENTIYVLACSQEGLIKQNLNDKAISHLKEILNDEKNQRKKGKYLLLFSLLIVCIFGTCYFVFSSNPYKATQKYNEAVIKYNLIAQEYNDLVQQVGVINIEKIPLSYGLLNEASDDKKEVDKSIEKGNSIEKIKKDTATVEDITDEISNGIVILKQIKSPKYEWVIDKLESIEDITGFEKVTKENDPNGLLSNDNGYTLCIYFSVDQINQEKVEGDTLIDKGNSAGGTIEVYRTYDDALKRVEYLSQFDNTVLYSGSYAIVGTSVIRTSHLLEEDEQIKLTDSIIKEFTKI